METKIEKLEGRTVERVEGCEEGSEEMTLYFTDGSYLRFFHEQDCCEHVCIEEVCGDVDDLIGTPIVSATESIGEPPGDYESATWTFYKLRTAKGDVTIRWLGESNGYYSESVDTQWYEAMPWEERS